MFKSVLRGLGNFMTGADRLPPGYRIKPIGDSGKIHTVQSPGNQEATHDLKFPEKFARELTEINESKNGERVRRNRGAQLAEKRAKKAK